VLLLLCSRTVCHVLRLSLAGELFPLCILSLRDTPCHVAQDDIVAAQRRYWWGLSKSKDSAFFTVKLPECSLQCFNATNFACQAWKSIRKHLLSRANCSVIMFSLLGHSQTLPGSPELTMTNSKTFKCYANCFYTLSIQTDERKSLCSAQQYVKF